MAARSPLGFHLVTLGCPKNAVDSEKVYAALVADGLVPVAGAAEADLLVVNTCAFVEAARQESIDAIMALAERRKAGARLVVTGCLAQRYGAELAAALPEADAVVGFAGETTLSQVVLPGLLPPGGVRDLRDAHGLDELAEGPRPAPRWPWAYLKVAEGCDRACAFCAIPSFRGAQRSRRAESIEAEARELVEQGVVELVLVAQDLASYGRDTGRPGALAPLLTRLDRIDGLRRLRLLYLYPSEVRGALVDAMLDGTTVVPYFDLSLQHASAPLLRRMRRRGDGGRFVSLIEAIRRRRPDAAFRSSFLVGFPGETEADHEELLDFLAQARLDWAGFFPFSSEDGTPAASLDGRVPSPLVAERLRECADVQDPITAGARAALIGREVEVLVDGVDVIDGADGADGAEEFDGGAGGAGGDATILVGRTHREAPEIDGVVRLAGRSAVTAGTRLTALVTGAEGPDLDAEILEIVEPGALPGMHHRRAG